MSTPGEETKPSPARESGRVSRLLLPLLLFVLFAVLIVAGLAFDEFASVLANAATICLSCIGIE